MKKEKQVKIISTLNKTFLIAVTTDEKTNADMMTKRRRMK